MTTQLQEPKKVQEVQEIKVQRPKRLKLSAEESLKRMEAFPERKEPFIAASAKARIEVYLPDLPSVSPSQKGLSGFQTTWILCAAPPLRH